MKSTKNALRGGIGIFIWVSVIFLLCSLPQEAIPNPQFHIPHLDKVVHSGLFFILSLLICYTFESYFIQRKNLYLLAILISLVYGGLVEILQSLFFQRSGDIWDLLADGTGSVAACIIYPYLPIFLKSGKSGKN